MVHLHLLGEERFEPCVLSDAVVDEVHGLCPLDFHRCLAFLPVVEPGFGPPPDAGTVGIDGDRPRYVETLDVDVQFRQRVDDAAGGYCFGTKFFFKFPPPIVERYTSCRRAR